MLYAALSVRARRRRCKTLQRTFRVCVCSVVQCICANVSVREALDLIHTPYVHRLDGSAHSPRNTRQSLLNSRLLSRHLHHGQSSQLSVLPTYGCLEIHARVLRCVSWPLIVTDSLFTSHSYCEQSVEWRRKRYVLNKLKLKMK